MKTFHIGNTINFKNYIADDIDFQYDFHNQKTAIGIITGIIQNYDNQWLWQISIDDLNFTADPVPFSNNEIKNCQIIS